MQTGKTLIKLSGCPGRSESTLGAHSFGWVCHVMDHLLIEDKNMKSSSKGIFTRKQLPNYNNIGQHTQDCTIRFYMVRKYTK